MLKILLVAVVGLAIGHVATAHELISDKTISAILHIDPNDVPTAGRPSSISYELKDSSGRFRINACDCTVHIRLGGQEIFSQLLAKEQAVNSLETSPVDFTFPRPDHYEVSLIGQPLTTGAFQRFALSHKVLVVPHTAAGALSAFSFNLYHSLSHYAYAGVFLIMFIILFARGQLTFQKKSRPVAGKTNA